MRIALKNVAADLTFAVGLQRAGQQDDTISQGLKQSPGRDVVLGSEDLGRRHERCLISIFDGDHGGLERNDGLSRSHIALKKTPHGCGTMHVVGDLLYYALLRSGGMKGKELFDRMAYFVT